MAHTTPGNHGSAELHAGRHSIGKGERETEQPRDYMNRSALAAALQVPVRGVTHTCCNRPTCCNIDTERKYNVYIYTANNHPVTKVRLFVTSKAWLQCTSLVRPS